MDAEDLKLLVLKKDTLEVELASLSAEIESLNQTKGFDKPLVDQEGFPRADLDFGELSSYRNLKRRRNELNNEHSALMKEIEKGLFALHATYPKVQTESALPVHQLTAPKEVTKQFEKKEPQSFKIDYLTPFAIITSVEPNSPAAASGIFSQDLLSQFAEINIYTMDGLKQIPKFVREGQPIKLVLLRKVGDPEEPDRVFKLKDGNNYLKVVLSVIPKQWEGRGLLGCKIDHL